jgi:O-antigen/teichoic acid export membrane protein
MIQVLLRKPGFILSASKIIRILVSFYTFAIIPRYLGVNEYGLIAVIGSATVFLSTLDLGFGQGLRNRINLVQDQRTQANMFYSVIFFLIFWTFIIGLVCYASLTNSNFSSDLFSIPHNRKDLIFAANISLFIFFINIPFSIQALLLMSYMEYVTIFIYDISNALFSIFLATILFFYKNSFPGYLFLVYSMIGMIFINVLFTFYFVFKRKWFKKKYLPNYDEIKKNVLDVFLTGKQFLFAGICYSIVFYADSIIVAKTSSLEKAGDYRILITIFQTGVTILQTYMSPLWDVSNKHYFKGEMAFLKRKIRKNNLLILIITIVGIPIAMFFLVPLLKLWTGRIISVSKIEIVVLLIWFLLNTLPYSYALFLNGISKLKEQNLSLLVGTIIKFPLGLYFGRLYGISGVIAASCIVLLINMIVYPLASYRYLNKRTFAVG